MLAIGVFLVDAYCLGVKDAFITVRTPSEYREMVTEGLSGRNCGRSPRRTSRNS
jgi:hypothetical protein